MWRRLTLLIATLAGIGAGVVLAIKSDRVATSLKGRLEQLVEERLGLTARIGTLEIEVMPPAITLHDVRIYEKDAAAPMLEIHRAAASAYSWMSPRGNWVIDRIEVDGVRGTLDLERLKHLLRADEAAPGPASASGLPVDIRRLLLWNVRLAIVTADWRLALADANFSASPAPRGGRDIELSVAGGVLTAGQRDVGFELQLRAALAGALDAPEKLTLSKAKLFLDEVLLDASGTIAVGPPLELDLRLESAASLRTVQQLVADVPPLAGDLRVEARVHGEVPALSARTHLSLANVGVAGRSLGDLDIEAVVDPSRVTVEALDWKHVELGEVTGSGSVELRRPWPVRVKTRLHGVLFETLLELAGLPDAWVRGTIKADVDARGELTPLRLQARLHDAAMDDFVVLDRSYRAADAVPYLELPGPTTLDGDVTVTDSQVAVGGISVRRGDTQLDVQGTMSFDPEAGMELHISGDSVTLGDIGPIARVTFDGSGSLAGVVEGPYADPTISATTSMQELAVAGYPVGETRATLIYSSLVLQLDRLSGRRGGGTFTGSGQILFTSEGTLGEGTVRLEAVGASDLLSTIGISPALARRFVANLSGDVTVRGPLAAPLGSVALTAPALVVDASSLGAASVHATFGDAEQPFVCEVATKADTGAITAQAAVTGDGTWRIGAELTGVSLAALKPLMGGADLDGTVDGKLSLVGRAEALTGRAEASVPALVAYKTSLGTTRLVGDVEGSRMHVRGTLLSGTGRADGQLELSAQLPYVITIALGREQSLLPLSTLWPSLSAYDISVAGTVFSQGRLTEADSIMADIELPYTRARLAGLTLEQARPLRLQYTQGSLRALEVALTGSGFTTFVKGATAVDGHTMDLRIDLGGDLEVARLALSRAQILRGRLDAKLALAGSWDEPSIVGEATVNNGILRLGDANQNIEQIAARVVFTGRSLEIESASGATGGGQLRLGGHVFFPNDDLVTVNLRTELSGITLRPSPNLQLTTGGTLSLGGTADDLLLAGDLRLASLRYSANLDLEQLIPKRNVPPLRVPAISEEKPVRLNVHVAAPDSILLSSNVVEAELQAELTVTGTTQRIGIVGSMTPLWARARYQDNIFTVERAAILFTDEYRIYTQFDLRARTEACGMQVAVDIHGSNDSYSIVPSGQDEQGPVSAQDVFTCLQLGVRMRDFRQEGGPTLSDSLPSSIDALWTVSGLDDEVRRVFPMVDELRLSSGWSARSKRSTPRLLLGKELGKDVQLTYSRALDQQEDQQLSVQYRLNELATVQGTWDSASDVQYGDFGLDLRLRWEFQ